MPRCTSSFLNMNPHLVAADPSGYLNWATSLCAPYRSSSARTNQCCPLSLRKPWAEMGERPSRLFCRVQIEMLVFERRERDSSPSCVGNLASSSPATVLLAAPNPAPRRRLSKNAASGDKSNARACSRHHIAFEIPFGITNCNIYPSQTYEV